MEQLLVKEGDWVQAGQAIAILDSRDHLNAAVNEAEEQVSVAQSKLAQIQAGALAGGNLCPTCCDLSFGSATAGRYCSTSGNRSSFASPSTKR